MLCRPPVPIRPGEKTSASNTPGTVTRQEGKKDTSHRQIALYRLILKGFWLVTVPRDMKFFKPYLDLSDGGICILCMVVLTAVLPYTLNMYWSRKVWINGCHKLSLHFHSFICVSDSLFCTLPPNMSEMYLVKWHGTYTAVFPFR